MATLKQVAAMLHGREIRNEVTEEIREAAGYSGVVIVYGASDDLMEIDGATGRDEVGCYDGGTALIDRDGLLPDRDNIDDDGDLEKYFARKKKAKSIEAVWCAEEDGPAWTYKTTIPHETFDIVEDGAVYCRGIVFMLADL